MSDIEFGREGRGYLARVDGERVARLHLQRTPDLVVVAHLEVRDETLADSPLVSDLIRFALDDLRATEERTVLPLAPEVKDWIVGHREYVDLVAGGPAWRHSA